MQFQWHDVTTERCHWVSSFQRVDIAEDFYRFRLNVELLRHLVAYCTFTYLFTRSQCIALSLAVEAGCSRGESGHVQA